MLNSSLEITCTRCNQVIHHACNESLRDILKHLLTLRVDSFPSILFDEKNEFYSEGDENAPFFSEAFLYVLLGKDDARTVLYNIEAVVRACGMDPHKLREEARRDAENDISTSEREWMRHVATSKENQGRVVTVRLPQELVEVLDAAVKEDAEKDENNRSSRSAVVAKLLTERKTI